MQPNYINRDVSWLSFNERVLNEAEKKSLPIMERINFLSIFSSNLDEFFRVRIPALLALEKVQNKKSNDGLLIQIQEIIRDHQEKFGKIIRDQLVPSLKEQNIHLMYEKRFPVFLQTHLTDYFLNKLLSFLHIVDLEGDDEFFPENNKLYMLVIVAQEGGERSYVVNIPSDQVPRFYEFVKGKTKYIVFLEDMVRVGLPFLFKGKRILSVHNFKITRSAHYEIENDLAEDMVSLIEHELKKREKGIATRFLFEGKIGANSLQQLKKRFRLRKASFMRGGTYHNLKDLRLLPLTAPDFFQKPWPRTDPNIPKTSIFDSIKSSPFIIHTPYHSFDPILRFFNEASVDPDVTSIYTTIYRIAKNSLIAHALINAARHGKKVFVFVELKARFDEENNLKWAKKMEAAGVKITFSLPELKVHSKIALIRRSNETGAELFGILGTGNFHENNAQLYTDHYLFTNDQALLTEVRLLFKYLRTKKKGLELGDMQFSRLLVGRFNLHESFIQYIEQEIELARNGLPASITLKVNNLEDKLLIDKLYAASNAGVKIKLIIRGICCLVPGVSGLSENITVTRIVDRYLEHGRIFLFGNNGSPVVIIGSSDWMERSMYRRIEVCFRVEEPGLKNELVQILTMQLRDNTQAVYVDSGGQNQKISKSGEQPFQSQKEISYWLSKTKKP
jgi:polyphosphate kinase